jgi:uncharacterized membrane protein YccC
MDSILQSLARGRILATVAGTTAASVSLTATATGHLNEITALMTALLAFVSAGAALYSKIREIRKANDA